MAVLDAEQNRLIWRRDHETVWVEAWGRDSVRVRSTKGPAILDLPGALLEPAPSQPDIEVNNGGGVLRNGAIEARVRPDGTIRFFKARTDAVLLAEQPFSWLYPPQRHYRSVGGDLYRLEVKFVAHDGERFYGLGQRRHGLLDQKGCVLSLMHENGEVSIPWLISSRGYGFLWNNPAIGRVELGRNGTKWVAEATRQMDYLVTTGETYGDLMARYGEATGRPPLLPDWATGFWQSKLRYDTQEKVLEVAREYKRRELPLSVIVIDYYHWTMQGDWRFDPEYWPDPAGMVRELEGMGVKVMVSVWPTVNANSPNFYEMRDRGLLVRSERGVLAHWPLMDTRPEGVVYLHFYDPMNPEARRYIWEKVRDGYLRHGIKVWWLDCAEPEFHPMDHDHLRFHLGNGLEVAGLFPLMHQQAFYDGMKAEGEDDVVMLSRSAWAGSQRYGAAVWSGDIESTFELLRAQVCAGLNIGLSGIPWWTTDIGGFLHGNPETAYFRELVVRWFQYGAFCPLFRLHGYREPVITVGKMGADNEVWSFGAEACALIEQVLFMRERLRPYINGLMREAHETLAPPMRPLFFDFPDDGACVFVDDQFMFGPDLLVAPVVHEGAQSRLVYLPDGAEWEDAWTGEKLDGGQAVDADAPLDRIPLYLRDGAPLPIRA